MFGLRAPFKNTYISQLTATTKIYGIVLFSTVFTVLFVVVKYVERKHHQGKSSKITNAPSKVSV